MAARVFIGLGSNVAGPAARVETALEQLAALPSTRLARASSLYKTAPVGPPNQPRYVNAVAELVTALTPLVLLAHLQRIERHHRRVRAQRWGKRTLDLDILLYDALTMDHPRLRIPHPQLHRRAFVLVPLVELDFTLVVPGRGTVARLLDGLHGSARASVRKMSGGAGRRAD